MPKHILGGKVTASHTTVIDEAEEIVKTAISLSEVRKVSLGIIKQIGTGKRKIKFKPFDGNAEGSGFQVFVRGSVTIQELWVYTSNPVRTREALFRAFWLRKNK